MKLVSGHPDDQNARDAAFALFHAKAPTYADEWPREVAYRFLHAMSAGDAGAHNPGPPSEKDLAAFVRTHAPSTAHEAFKVESAILLFEVVHGAERVASEIVGHLERRADALWSLGDAGDNLFTLLRGLAEVRDRMTHSDRSRLDARIRVLLAYHPKGTKVADELEGILKRPESIAPPPPPPPPPPEAEAEAAPEEVPPPTTKEEKRPTKKAAGTKKRTSKKGK